jgi:hypothetical protein
MARHLLYQHLMMRIARWSIFAASALIAIFGCFAGAANAQSEPSRASAAATPPDPALYRFVVLGDDRVSNFSADNPSTANVNQLDRSFAEIAALSPAPAYIFFNGDLVLGPGKGTTQQLDARLKSDLEAWLLHNKWPAAPLPATQLVPIPGNHELNWKAQEQSLIGAEGIWLEVMEPWLRPFNNGPLAGASLCGDKKLVSNQSRLTYSFEVQASPAPDARYDHFIVINTDPLSPSNDLSANSSTVPLNWIQSDLAAARSQPTTWHVFAIGHKPAYSPAQTKMGSCGQVDYVGCGTSTSKADSTAKEECTGLNSHPAMRDQLFDSFNTAHAAIYFASHVHLWDASKPPHNKFTWQIIAGNGGAPPVSKWKPDGGQYFGFTVVTVMSSGRVMIASYGRNLETNILDPVTHPTTLRACFCIGGNGGPEKQACSVGAGLPVASNATLSCTDQPI